MSQLKEIQTAIEKSCETVGRSAHEITLIAVSKTKPLEAVQEIYDQGIRCFGENRVQELLLKKEALPDDIQWHMLGHLQRNKVKSIVGQVALIHSVDSIRLLEALEDEAKKQKKTVSILLEVNIAQEKSKFGFTTDNLDEALVFLSKCTFITCKGLMTVAPYVSKAEENRGIFSKLNKLAVDIRTKNIDNIDMSILSMGMSGDYEVAIEEGATMVRIGTAIFGERNITQ